MFSLFSSDPLEPGAPAPQFTCLDDGGQPFDLARQRGRRVVLVFYPFDNTPVCTKQLCELRDGMDRLQARNTVVCGVNPGNQTSHAGFKHRHGFPFPLLVDSGQKIARLYGCGGLVVIKRTVYVIDEAGVIRYSKRGKPPLEEILEVLG